MKILVSGPNGLIGSKLRSQLETGGDQVVGLSRAAANERQINWDPEVGQLDVQQLQGFDAVVHLAGESIASGRWNESRKRRIHKSRIEGTRLLAQKLAELDDPPKVLISASAIGFYGDRADDQLGENSLPGEGFLPDLCGEWEAATKPAQEKGIRVVNLRFGVVLSPEGGALQKMLLPFKLGLGGIVGNGKQYWSWIAIDDVVGAIAHAIDHEKLRGPVNVTAPVPATNREFTKALGKVLKRPTIFPLPAFAARLVLGEMADALLLASARVLPNKLNESGYEFRYPDLEAALNHLLKK